MKNLLAISFLFCSLAGMAQSETNNPYTRDTVIKYWYNQWANEPFQVRITTQRNDNTPRPTIIQLPGKGEQGTDTTKLVLWGPHNQLLNGWDGGIVLGNGTHYPNFISIIGNDQSNLSTPGLYYVITTLLKLYPINPKAVHLTGLSMGAWGTTSLITYEVTPGDEAGMKLITSIAPLSGAATYTGKWNLLGHWAKKYGGRMFSTAGYADGNNLNPPLAEKAMNDSVKGSAYFAYNNINGGTHCCWNTVYDPKATNWQSFPPYGPYITISTDTNSRGTYKIGSSLYQWQLRQGDTTLVGGSSPVILPPPNKPPVAIIYPISAVTAPTAWVLLDGTPSFDIDGTIDSVAFTQVSGPSQANLIYSTCGLTAGAVGLIPGTYIFKLTVWDDKNAAGQALVYVVVNPAPIPPPVAVFTFTVAGKTTTVYSDGSVK